MEVIKIHVLSLFCRCFYISLFLNVSTQKVEYVSFKINFCQRPFGLIAFESPIMGIPVLMQSCNMAPEVTISQLQGLY